MTDYISSDFIGVGIGPPLADEKLYVSAVAYMAVPHEMAEEMHLVPCLSATCHRQHPHTKEDKTWPPASMETK